jgi:Zn finger protein HypA/HybF involved in hydrogenase expression
VTEVKTKRQCLCHPIKKRKRLSPAGYKCQFCRHYYNVKSWHKLGKCPGCGREYNALLAQEGDD